MAASRKLQGEIDRCLKKVAEGVEQFEDIWQKVHNATNSNQKEKYEADLKKEIKKLQRLRDQIKSWLASGEIKDKSQLLENRKLIETQMERFKVVERETKTKAYSKEGLGAAQNKDPAQREREEVNNWLSSSIDTLNIQMDQFESEIESLMATQKKKKMDKDKSDRIEDLKEYIDRHQYHIKKLEILMRMLDNQSIDCDQIKMIKEDVEYYIESSQDPDFNENLGLYDDIDMDDLDYPTPEITVGKHVLGGSHDSTDGSTPSSACGSSPAPSPATNHSNDHDAPTTPHDKKRSSKNEESRSLSSTSQPVKPLVVRPTTNSIINSGSLSSSNSSNTNNSSSVSSTSIVVVNSNSSSKATPPPSTPTKPVSGSTSQTTPNNSSTSSGTSNHLITSASLHNSTGRHSPEPSGLMNSSIVNSNSGSGSSSSSSSSSSCSNSSSSSGNSISNSTGSGSSSSSSSSSNGLSSGVSSSVSVTSPQGSVAGSATTTPALPSGAPTPSVPSAHSGHTPTMNAADTAVSLKAIAQKKVNEVNSSSIPPSVLDGSSCVVSSSSTTSSTNTNSNNNSSSTNSSGKCPATCEAHIPPLLGVAPLGPAQLTVEHELQFKMLQAAFFHMPHPSDSERLRLHLPRQPCQTPLYYPQVSGLDPLVSPPMSDTVDFFQRLSTETLFFIFYYMEGTKAQYLAAKALKKQSWRFHTKYMMWFQRHEEPKAITDEYEQGTYIYFDYENWGQRKKENFTFEYRFLEDRDLN
ncbi:CCR4-NOT transcription complex subunit 3 isoform X6 [Procambarus clarkii]|uniref:CCR4-NOT transcription complex subunit 3 isoform X6 n=1 Tax=Procambarus clarkii TaxID=6728 RepID=UPI001E676D45|nr:CCR4-NOT transcription complex subunit 3-like isoform X5 [Procambarus clarkii]